MHFCFRPLWEDEMFARKGGQSVALMNRNSSFKGFQHATLEPDGTETAADSREASVSRAATGTGRNTSVCPLSVPAPPGVLNRSCVFPVRMNVEFS